MFAKYSGRYPTLLSSLVPLPNKFIECLENVTLHHICGNAQGEDAKLPDVGMSVANNFLLGRAWDDKVDSPIKNTDASSVRRKKAEFK